MIGEPFTPEFLRRLQQLKIHTRRMFLGTRQGIHRSRRRGHGIEFADYRLYAPGDDFRHIDWNTYARTDRLYVREFQEEQALNVLVILDTSASMGYPEDSNKFTLARNIALALGYISLTDGDSVAFSLLGMKNTPRYAGQRAIGNAKRELDEVIPRGSFDFVAEVRKAIAYQKTPGKCFFVSDFLIDTETQFRCFDLLRARNYDTSVIQILSPNEFTLNPELNDDVIDSETGEIVELSVNQATTTEYAKLLSSHIAKLEHYCFKASMPHILISTSHTLSDVVLTELPARGLLK